MNSFGKLLKLLRTAKKKSQLDLAIEADISSKHLSFLESGKALPGRDVVKKLSTALKLPDQYKSILFLSAGFSSYFPENTEKESDLFSPLLDMDNDEFYSTPSCTVGWDGKIKVSNQAMNYLLSAILGKEKKANDLYLVSELLLGKEGFGPFLLHFDYLRDILETRCSLENFINSNGTEIIKTKLNALDNIASDKLTIRMRYNGILTFNIIQAVIGNPLEVNSRSIRIYYMIPSDSFSKNLMKNLISANHKVSTNNYLYK